MKKRVCSLALALLLVLSALPFAAFAGKEEARSYGTVPIYTEDADVNYMAQQLLEDINPTGDTPEERILCVYNWIIRNCDREGPGDKTYFDEAEVEKKREQFLKDMKKAERKGSIVYRMDIAAELIEDGFPLTRFDTNDYISRYAYDMMLYRVGTCVEYSSLLALLLGHMGYDCRVIAGDFLNSNGTAEQHKWNMVLLNGEYLWLDPRMDHANYVRTGTLEHKYFLVSDTAQWETKHSWDHGYSEALMASVDLILDGYGLLAQIPEQVAGDFPTMDPWANCSAWAVPFLRQAVEQKIYPDILVQTDMTRAISRAEFASVAVKYYEALTGKTAKLKKGFENPFEDVEDDQTDILIACQLGVVKGLSETTFGPDAPLTRAQAVTMLGRVAELVQTDAIVDGAALELGEKQVRFTDAANIDGWSANYVNYFVSHGVIDGMGDGTFAPRANMTREQAMKVAVAALDK